VVTILAVTLKQKIMPNILQDQTLAQIRRTLTQIERSSDTSAKFQDDLLGFIEQNHFNGFSVVEVGCYVGGLTAQLAFVAKKFNLEFDVIDIDPGYLNVAANTVDRVGLTECVRFHAIDLTSFVRNSPGYGKPTLVFVDADHRYDGVVTDIRAIKSFASRPYACAFHDFSLRYADGPLTDVRVDCAIMDEFGPGAPLTFIGEIAGQGTTLRTEPGADRHFHEHGQSEGVLIVLG
jgi:hypothetical protein